MSKQALLLGLTTLVLFLVLSLLFGSTDRGSSFELSSSRRHLEDNQNDDDNSGSASDYSKESCHSLYDIPVQDQCQFAKHCNRKGIWGGSLFFCTFIPTSVLVTLASPFIILWMVLLFRLLGSTAEDFFSPSLEMFANKLGLPPRFAGVSLLALGNGAADVSATISAISNDANGYQLSLGALTGAAMVINCVIAALVIIVAGGVPCRGALVRDVTALGASVLVVFFTMRQGTIDASKITLFLSLYFVFVLIVLVADIYHRAVVVPRIRQYQQDQERQRQFRVDTTVNNLISGFSNYDRDSTVDGWEGDNNNLLERPASPTIYENSSSREGIESEDFVRNQPVLLNSPINTTTTTPSLNHHISNNGIVSSDTDYAMLEDDICVEPNSHQAIVASNWHGALEDGQDEVKEYLSEEWNEILKEETSAYRALMVLEFPFSVMRRFTIPIPCEGYYVRAMVASSIAISPFWFLFYLTKQGLNVFALSWTYPVSYVIATSLIALFTIRYSPTKDMNMWFATPIALYGFIMAATWIDTIADNLVSLLDFLGILFGIPGPIVGLTVLAWGNSSADLSANLAMARKGLANMAITACFAGPLFNILVGLGLGFSSRAAKTGETSFSVSLPSSVTIGFVFIVLNALLVLAVGLPRGRIVKEYGYVALGLYAVYVVTGISWQYVF